MFSCTKGAPNHTVSDMWKATVRKEIAIEKSWKQRFAKGKYEEEQRFVNELLQMQQSPSRTEGQNSPSSGTSADLLLGGSSSPLTLSRKEILRQHVESGNRGLRPLASREIGKQAGDRYNVVLLCERLGTAAGQSSYGKKPIINTSFYRAKGVM